MTTTGRLLHEITDDHRAQDVADNYGLTPTSTYSLRDVTVAKIKVPFYGDIEDEESAEWIARLIADGADTFAPVVLEGDEDNGYYVVDGHHRSSALKSLGVATVEAWVADPD